MDPSAANPTTLLGAQSLGELMGTANALRRKWRIWMLLPIVGKQYLLTGEACEGLDSLVGDRTSIDRIPVLFEPIATTEPWARAMLDLLQYQEDWLEQTQFMMPVWEDGRLLGVIGAASQQTVDEDIHGMLRYVGAAIRKLDQWETGRRDFAALKAMLRQPDKSTLVATSRGRVIGGTQGGLAILNKLLNFPRSRGEDEETTLPQVLRAMITRGDSSAVIDDLKVFLNRPALPAPTTVEPLCWFTFARHLKDGPATVQSTASAYESLSPAERRVIPLALQGKQNKEIAQDLFLSPHTVKRHMRHILSKYGCPDRVTLILRGQATAPTPPASLPTAKPMVPALPVVTCPSAPKRKVGETA